MIYTPKNQEYIIKSIFLTLTLSFCICLAFAPDAMARNGVNVSITSGLLFIDDINGLDHKVGHTFTYTYTVQIESDITIQGATLGFFLYSPDGSLTDIIWNSVPANVGRWGEATTWNLTGSVLSAGPNAFNGLLPSLWMTGGVTLPADESGYGPVGLTDALKFTITFPGVDGGILCLDSTFFPPASTWLMSPFDGSLIIPEWSGGAGDLGASGGRDHAFCVTTFVIANIPPCPNTATISHCETLRYQAFAIAPDPDNQPVIYSVTTTGNGIASVNTTGNVIYVPGANEIGEIFVTTKATKPDGAVVECITSVSITNTPPAIICPPNIAVVEGNTGVSAPVSVSDPDACDSHVYSLVSVVPTPTGAVSVDPSSGAVTFSTDRADAVADLDTPYNITIAVTDGIDTVHCAMVFSVLNSDAFCIRIDQTDKTTSPISVQGQQVDICINFDGGSKEIGGFDFLISYDANVLLFIGATEGNIFPDYEWEMFTFRFAASGKLRIIGLAETNNGLHHPTNFQLVQGDQFACLTFFVPTDPIFECQFSPIRWDWLDCGDNSLASTAGDTVYISRSVYDYIGTDNANIATGFRADLTGADQTFPTSSGAPTVCDTPPASSAPTRFIDYKNGGVIILCVDDIGERGDVNDNSVSFEIADAVMLRNYFVNGLSAFGSHIAASINASEVNCDSIPLTVADYVFIWRVIIGSFLSFCPDSGVTDDTVTIATNNDVIASDKALGAVLFVFEGVVTPTLLATNMELQTGIVDGNTHALVFTSSTTIETEIISPGPVLQSEGKLLSVDASDTLGATMVVTLDFATDVIDDDNSPLPRSFALHQNYPNPFNPSTTITIDFPRRSKYSLIIYNIRGQKVKSFSGVYGAGTLDIVWEPSELPSGVYFYKLRARDFVATKKMVLLK